MSLLSSSLIDSIAIKPQRWHGVKKLDTILGANIKVD